MTLGFACVRTRVVSKCPCAVYVRRPGDDNVSVGQRGIRPSGKLAAMFVIQHADDKSLGCRVKGR